MQNKTLDILVAEMLGDIGKLHDQVADLKVELPSILNQMKLVIAAQKAKADVLQEPIQQAIRVFIRQELNGISVAAKEAKQDVLNALEVDISDLLRKKVNWVQSSCDKSFEVAAKKFELVLTESATVAETTATTATNKALSAICRNLKVEIEALQKERWQGLYLRMIVGCSITGVLVGILARFISK